MDDSWSSIENSVSQPVWKAIKEFNFVKMTPVQAACIPRMLRFQDVAAEAITGSGKTIAFIVPLLQIILRREDPVKKYDLYALVLSPTRELAAQTYEVLHRFLKHTPDITSMLLVGGASVNDDLKHFENKGANIIIGTPGRVCDAFSQNRKNKISMAMSCKKLEMLVLDEADRLLELGFSESINTILAYLPKQRRTGLFSATQTSDVINLIRAGLRNPVQIKVKEESSNQMASRTPSQLSNYFMVCDADKKFSTLMKILTDRNDNKTIIFFATCASVDYFNRVLASLLPNIKILPIHGKMKSLREKMFEKFRKLDSGILLCTDLMCRGIDIPQVEQVIQFDPPSQSESFVHRCGRTARAGCSGSSILMLIPEESDYVRFIQLNQNVQLQKMDPPEKIPNLLEKIRKLQLKDRDMMDKANKAFVSFVQFYKSHKCRILFKLSNLNLGLLAIGFGLLKLPKMPEMKGAKTDAFIEHKIDLNNVAYKNQEREQSRMKKLEIYNKTGKWPSDKKKSLKMKQTVSWSKKKEGNEKKKLKKQDKLVKKQKRMERMNEEDMDELDEDEKMYKKLKKKKITAEEYDEFLGCTKAEENVENN